VLARENLANNGPIKEPRSFKLPRRGEVTSQGRGRKAEPYREEYGKQKGESVGKQWVKGNR
jgi:hypothetical protein